MSGLVGKVASWLDCCVSRQSPFSWGRDCWSFLVYGDADPVASPSPSVTAGVALADAEAASPTALSDAEPLELISEQAR